jgi:Protein of unknown function (DUF4238)
MIERQMVADGKHGLIAVSHAAVESGFYAVRLPDGSFNHELEPSFAPLEELGARLARRALTDGPPSGHERGQLAAFIAFQLLRGPAFKRLHEAAVANTIEKWEDRLSAIQSDGYDPVEYARSFLDQDARRLNAMSVRAAPVATVLAAMHWMILDSTKATFVTCDHPVVVRGDPREPIDDGQRFGVLDAVEILYPLSPRALLVMTWVDQPHDLLLPTDVLDAPASNALVSRQAYRQWFSQPGTSPRFSRAPTQQLPLLAGSRFDRYDWFAARSSERRRLAEQAIAARTESDDAQGRMTLIQPI